ncbi:MAG: hypothetical protein PHD67_01295 [Oscillospiraceae bacterium]|nr:hypothetical protein [Oscillospiraceae bacterium]
MARLYTPEEFGGFALFSGAVSCLTQAACLKYDLAVTTAKEEREAAALFWLSAISPLAAALIWTAGAALWGGAAGWIWWAPAAIPAGWFAALTGWQSRREDWAKAGWGGAAKGMGAALLQLLFGGWRYGLEAGQALGWLLGAAAMAQKLPPACRWGEIGSAAKKYRRFPLFLLPGALAGAAAYGAIPFWLGGIYGEGAAGQFALVNRLLGAPLSLFTSAVGQAFLRKAAAEKNAGRSVSRLYFGVSGGAGGGLAALLCGPCPVGGAFDPLGAGRALASRGRISSGAAALVLGTAVHRPGEHGRDRRRKAKSDHDLAGGAAGGLSVRRGGGGKAGPGAGESAADPFGAALRVLSGFLCLLREKLRIINAVPAGAIQKEEARLWTVQRGG